MGVMIGATPFMFEVLEVIDWTDNDASEPLLRVGLTALIGGYGYGIWDAAPAAKEHNARAAPTVPVSIAYGPSGGSFAFAVRLHLP